MSREIEPRLTCVNLIRNTERVERYERRRIEPKRRKKNGDGSSATAAPPVPDDYESQKPCAIETPGMGLSALDSGVRSTSQSFKKTECRSKTGAAHDARSMQRRPLRDRDAEVVESETL